MSKLLRVFSCLMPCVPEIHQDPDQGQVVTEGEQINKWKLNFLKLHLFIFNDRPVSLTPFPVRYSNVGQDTHTHPGLCGSSPSICSSCSVPHQSGSPGRADAWSARHTGEHCSFGNVQSPHDKTPHPGWREVRG